MSDDARDPDDVIDADAAVVAGEEPPSARLPLDRDRIVAAAISFIDEFGLPGLTMRRLGGILGVEAMSLYRYVPGRESLLDAVVEAIVEEMRVDEEVLDEPRDGWQDFLQRLAHGVRRIALSHPRVFPLVASRPAEAPWLRPPLRSLTWVETFLQGLHQGGVQRRRRRQRLPRVHAASCSDTCSSRSPRSAPTSARSTSSTRGRSEDTSLAPYPAVQRM